SLSLLAALPVGDLWHIDVERARHRRLPVKCVLALLGQCNADRAHLAHAGGDTGLLLQPDVEIGGVLRQTRHVLGAAQLANETCGMPGRAAGKLLSFQKYDVGPAKLGEVVGDRAPGNASADDDDARLGGKVGHEIFLSSEMWN